MNASGSGEPVTVCGGGLAGCMIALLLARRGCRVRVIEYRQSNLQNAREAPQVEERAAFGQLVNAKARSINLALSFRGICALKKIGVFDRVQPTLIPMEGRAVHSLDGRVQLQPYGKEHQAIYSVSRGDLNDILIAELSKFPNVEMIWGEKVSRVSSDGSVSVVDVGGVRREYKSRFAIGADGAFSAVRQSMMRMARVNFSQSYIRHGYKELTIPPNSKGDFALSLPNALHIWPRHHFMLIALPNPDKTFTCTLFAPFEGDYGLESVRTKEQCRDYFNHFFPDVVPLMPRLADEFFENPNSPLITVRCNPWVHEDRVALLGDAAHASVPFYGQGMNCAFEDCLVFDEIYESLEGDPTKVLPEFNRIRQPIGDAIADLSLQNYDEMASKTASVWFLAKRRLELMLYRLFPHSWIPLYNMVTFTRIPYHEAIVRARRQDRILAFSIGALSIGAAAVAVRALLSKWRPK